jgi:hypothetical protein
MVVFGKQARCLSPSLQVSTYSTEGGLAALICGRFHGGEKDQGSSGSFDGAFKGTGATGSKVRADFRHQVLTGRNGAPATEEAKIDRKAGDGGRLINR